MKNYHITASNSALEIPLAAKFNALAFRVIEMFRRGEVTSLSGPIWVGLGSRGRGLLDAVQISMKNYHITASNSALESPSAAKFNALMLNVIEKLQKGGR